MKTYHITAHRNVFAMHDLNRLSDSFSDGLFFVGNIAGITTVAVESNFALPVVNHIVKSINFSFDAKLAIGESRFSR